MTTSIHDIHVFLSIAGYYSRFVPKYTNKAAALIDLIKESNSLQLTAVALESFELIKFMVSIEPILKLPRFDLPFVYSTDASSVTVGAFLQLDLGLGLLPLSYVSRKLNSEELRYSIEDREFLAIVCTIVKWRHYLAGGSKWAVCLTDHEPLKYLYSNKDFNMWLSRWIENIIYIYPIILWVPGKKLVVSNALNCRPDYGKCSSLGVKPNFIGNVSKCTFDPYDVEMVVLIASV